MEYVTSEKVSVEFYLDSVQSLIESERAGHPMFVEKEFIRIVIPGSQLCIIETSVEPMHTARFPEQYKRFQAGLSGDGISGWKLEAWPTVNTAQVKGLKHVGVHTVEQLADLSDSVCQSVGMGTMELRIKAKTALQAAAGNADTERQAAENKRLNDELESLKAQFAIMAADRSSDEPAPRGPGRPRKE